MTARGPIGILALQGGFAAHAQIVRGLGREVREVRAVADLEGLGGIVLPGGESSAMLKLLAWTGLQEPLNTAVRNGLPTFATCAGLILAATHVTNPEQASFGWLDVDVARNAWGRQVHSFEAESDEGAGLGADPNPFKLVFIRAPRMVRVGPAVEVLATWQGEPIAVRHNNVLAVTFHPELAGDDRLHRLIFAASEWTPPGENA